VFKDKPIEEVCTFKDLGFYIHFYHFNDFKKKLSHFQSVCGTVNLYKLKGIYVSHVLCLCFVEWDYIVPLQHNIINNAMYSEEQHLVCLNCFYRLLRLSKIDL
jgi:hypothetical protein